MTAHSHESSERVAFSNWINLTLVSDPDCQQFLPINPRSQELYRKVQDGLVFCKLVNRSFPGVIDERAINRPPRLIDLTHKLENLALALNAARCHGSNLGTVDLNAVATGNPNAILEFLWQVIRSGFLQDINYSFHPEILELRKNGETLNEVKELAGTEIVMRYVNYHLAKSGLRHTVRAFDDDFKDCILYAHLIYRLAPRDLKYQMILPGDITKEKFSQSRCTKIISNLKLLKADAFLTEDDFQNGGDRKESAAKLHFCTMAYLFHNYPGDLSSAGIQRDKPYSASGENLDEYVCRSFLNSFDIQPYSNHLLHTCRSGLAISQMLEIMRPGICNNVRFTTEFDGRRSDPQRIQNNTKIIKLAEKYPLAIASDLDPEKMSKFDHTCIVGLLTEMMMMHITRNKWNEKDAIEWVNEQLRRSSKNVTIKDFGDRVINEENIFAEILDAAAPGSLDRTCLGNNRLLNAKYYISVAWKAGVPIYTLPEHFVKNNSTFIAMAFANLIPY